MRRLARHAFTILSAISLLLCLVAACVATMTLDGRRIYKWTRGQGNDFMQVSSGEGYLGTVARGPFRDAEVNHPKHSSGWRSGFTGWTYQVSHDRSDTFQPPGSASIATVARASWYLEITMPGWAVVLLLAVLPALWLIRRKQQRRLQAIGEGLCPTCGYDLRATPAGDRCPECGEMRTE